MTVYLVRHAMAGARSKWSADDRTRPLTSQGRHQAADLVDLFAEFRITRVLSSPYRRCVETVAPLAAAIGVNVEIHEALAEGPGGPALKLARSLASEQAVLCSHGDIIPSILEALVAQEGLSLGADAKCQKASTWILEPCVSGLASFSSASYVPPPR